MAESFVKLAQIEEIVPHPNADTLEICRLGGWYVISKKDIYHVGDWAIHFPPDIEIPRELAEELGVAGYLSWKSGATHGRVKATSIRGQVSYGFLSQNKWNAKPDEDLKERLAIRRWEPAEESPGSGRMLSGDFAKKHPIFNPHYDVENMRNYKNTFIPGEECVATEKADGTSCSSAASNVFSPSDLDDVEDGILYMCGSRGGRRKMRAIERNRLDIFKMKCTKIKMLLREWIQSGIFCSFGNLKKGLKEVWRVSPKEKDSVYWTPYDKYPQVKELLCHLVKDNPFGIVGPICANMRGEVYGSGIANGNKELRYGRETPDWVCFDIQVNDKYLDWDVLVELCNRFNLPLVPVIYRGQFDWTKLEQLSSGETIIGNSAHFREGICVRPIPERQDTKLGRVHLKIVSGEYLASKANRGQH